MGVVKAAIGDAVVTFMWIRLLSTRKNPAFITSNTQKHSNNKVVSALISEEKVAKSSFSDIDASRLTYLEGNSCLCEVGGVKILVNPILVGKLDFGIPLLYDARKKYLKNFQLTYLPEIDCLLITQSLHDHCHLKTLNPLLQKLPNLKVIDTAKALLDPLFTNPLLNEEEVKEDDDEEEEEEQEDDNCSYGDDISDIEKGDNSEFRNPAKRSEDILLYRTQNGLICREFAVKETHKVVRSEDEIGNKMVNEYVREYKIGSGSYGKVVLYRSQVDGKHHAIKAFHKSHLLKLRVAPSETAMTDALHEVLIMKMLNHPNIVNFIEVIDDPNTDHFYMVLEYIEGKWVFKEAGPPGGPGQKVSRRYLRDIVSGLMYLHSHAGVRKFASSIGQSLQLFPY